MIERIEIKLLENIERILKKEELTKDDVDVLNSYLYDLKCDREEEEYNKALDILFEVE